MEQMPIILRSRLLHAWRTANFILIAITTVLAVASQPARAGGCTYASPFTQQTITVPLSGTILVPRDAPVNTILYQVNGPNFGTVTMARCSSSGTQYADLLTQPYANLGGNVFATSVPGVGVKILTWGGSNYPLSAAYVGSAPISFNSTNGPAIRYVFVKTGPITPGSISATDVPTARFSLDRSLTLLTTVISGSVNFVVGSCTTPDVSVPLGSHLTSELTGPNTVTAAANFNITLAGCPAGMNSIQYQVDPAPGITVVNAANSVVSLDSGSQAQGIGVQLLNGTGGVFPLSTRNTFTGYNSSTGGSYAIPMKARYYQTGATVGPGTANTSMTLTMTYQ